MQERKLGQAEEIREKNLFIMKEKKEAAGLTPSGELQAGYIFDFVSGLPVRATPEEVYSTQIFSRRLVEDFDYLKEQITTRPQFRVRKSPSEEKKKSYPVDIAVFGNEKKHDSDLLMVVECKAPNVKEGRKQLEIYLSMCNARIGVWFSGTSEEGSSHLCNC